MPNKAIYNPSENSGKGIAALQNSIETEYNTNPEIVEKRISEIKKEYKDFISECVKEHKLSLTGAQKKNEFIEIDKALNKILKRIRMSLF